MLDIMITLGCVSQYLDATALRQLTRITEAMLSMTGRVTMLGVSRWAGSGGSYRTVQHFFPRQSQLVRAAMGADPLPPLGCGRCDRHRWR